MIHGVSLLSSTAKVTLSFKNSAREPKWPRFLALHSPDLTLFDLHLWRILEVKVYKTNPHTSSSAVALSALGQEGNIFNNCCRTGEILLDFLKVIFTAKSFSHFLHRLLNLLRLGLGCSTSGVSGRTLLLQQGGGVLYHETKSNLDEWS